MPNGIVDDDVDPGMDGKVRNRTDRRPVGPGFESITGQAKDFISIGGSVKLVKVEVLSRWLGIEKRRARRWLRDLHVPTLRVEGSLFFSLYALEGVLFSVLSVGGQGLKTPGTDRPGRDVEHVRRIPVEDLESLADPSHPIHTEMAMVGVTYGVLRREDVEKQLERLGDALIQKRTKHRIRKAREIKAVRLAEHGRAYRP